MLGLDALALDVFPFGAFGAEQPVEPVGEATAPGPPEPPAAAPPPAPRPRPARGGPGSATGPCRAPPPPARCAPIPRPSPSAPAGAARPRSPPALPAGASERRYRPSHKGVESPRMPYGPPNSGKSLMPIVYRPHRLPVPFSASGPASRHTPRLLPKMQLENDPDPNNVSHPTTRKNSSQAPQPMYKNDYSRRRNEPVPDSTNGQIANERSHQWTSPVMTRGR